MSYTFSNCWNLTSLNLLSFDTNNVINMEHMFDNSFNLVNLNLSSFSTNQVTNMNNMFANCYNLISLDLSNFDSSKGRIDNMFTNSTKIEKIVSGDEKICEVKP